MKEGVDDVLMLSICGFGTSISETGCAYIQIMRVEFAPDGECCSD